MSYQSLYRRQRPRFFSEMIGQEHIVKTLQNALTLERVVHAYLFSGPRGTGKTTAAKIFAQAMNCQEYPALEPCGKCSSCQNIEAGVSIDMIEMDAASNRGIEEIRLLRERTRYASGESRFKVYIIDEAHMLTIEAANAFLKTLEEPPPGVVFILATTDPSRLPATIVSRCQRFDFHLLTAEQIRFRLEQVLEEEKWHAESEALDLIARLAEGSLRDALGILEQCAAYAEQRIAADQVRLVTGATKSEYIDAIVGALIENDLETGLSMIEQIVCTGRDLQMFQRDFAYLLGRLLLAGSPGNKGGIVKAPGFDEAVAKYKNRLDQDTLLNLVELLHETAGELRQAHFPRHILEIMLIRMARLVHGCPEASGPVLKKAAEGIKKPVSGPAVSYPKKVEAEKEPERVVKKPEEAAKELKIVAEEPEKIAEEKVSVIEEASAPEAPALKEPALKEPPEKEAAPAGGEEESEQFAALEEAWPRIVNEIKKRQKTTAAWMEPAVLTALRGRRVVVTFAPEYEVHKIRLMGDNHRKLVEAVLSAFYKKEMELTAELGQIDEDEKNDAGSLNDAGMREEEPLPPQPDYWQEAEDTSFEAPLPEVESKTTEPPVDEQSEKRSALEEALDIFGGRVIDLDAD